MKPSKYIFLAHELYKDRSHLDCADSCSKPALSHRNVTWATYGISNFLAVTSWKTLFLNNYSHKLQKMYKEVPWAFSQPPHWQQSAWNQDTSQPRKSRWVPPTGLAGFTSFRLCVQWALHIRRFWICRFNQAWIRNILGGKKVTLLLIGAM